MQLDPYKIPLPPSPAITLHSLDSSESNFSTTYLLDQDTPTIMSVNSNHNEGGSPIKVLESHNYHIWSNLMLSYFLEHNLDGIVDGSETQPTTTSADSQNWLLRQKKAAGFIASKLNASNRDLFINDSTRRHPHALGIAIELEYASKKARNRSRLFTRFLSLNCADGNLTKFTSSI